MGCVRTLCILGNGQNPPGQNPPGRTPDKIPPLKRHTRTKSPLYDKALLSRGDSVLDSRILYVCATATADDVVGRAGAHLCDATTHVLGTPAGKLGRATGPQS